MFASKSLTLAEAERLCRWYFRAGFIGLPWLWFATWLYFRHHARESADIAWYTSLSLRLSLLGAFFAVAWYFIALLALPPTSSLFGRPLFL